MNEGVDLARYHIRIGLKVVACVELNARIAPFCGAFQEVMQDWINSGFGNVGIGTEIVSRIEQSVRPPTFEGSYGEVMLQRRYLASGDVGIRLAIKLLVEQAGSPQDLQFGLRFRRIG